MRMAIAQLVVFPTCVGMNRRLGSRQVGWWSVPHVRGDEPPISVRSRPAFRVPHVRGDEPALLKT